MAMTIYKKGAENFTYHLAKDAIWAFLGDHRSVRQYLASLTNRLEKYGDSEDEGDLEKYQNALEEATAAANELARKIKNENGDDFCGAYYKQLLAAVYDEVNIPN